MNDKTEARSVTVPLIDWGGWDKRQLLRAEALRVFIRIEYSWQAPRPMPKLYHDAVRLACIDTAELKSWMRSLSKPEGAFMPETQTGENP